jgi:hypothetical protein
MLVNAAESHPSSARFVGQNELTEPVQWQVDEIYKMIIEGK